MSRLADRLRGAQEILREAPAAEPPAPSSLRVLANTPRQRQLWRQVSWMLGPVRVQAGLDLGGGGVLSARLRQRGGVWCSLERPGEPYESLQRMVGENAWPLEGPNLPFEDQTFDCLVVVDLLLSAQDDETFIHECHRVIKPAGWIVVVVPYARSGLLLGAARRMLGMTAEREGWRRPGFRAGELYAVLKNGFDIQETRRFSRLLVETTDLVARRAAGAKTDVALDRVFRHWGPVLQAAALLDSLLLLCRGYRLIARAKRRLWIPRRTPVLRDGRTIAEATLQTRIGTASALAVASELREKSQIRTRR